MSLILGNAQNTRCLTFWETHRMEVLKQNFMEVEMGFYGPCVVARHRKDGTSRFRFEVRRNRPPGWKMATPILVDGKDGCFVSRLTPAQIAGVKQRAEDLFRQVARLRAAGGEDGAVRPVPSERSWERLIELRKGHTKWTDLKPASQAAYQSSQRWLLKLFGSDPALAPSVILESQVDVIFRRIPSLYRRRSCYLELCRLLEKATREGWRDAALTVSYRVRRPIAWLQLWTAGELSCAATSALQIGEPGLAKLMFAQWEIGQRLQSVRNFRYGINYADGCFFYKCVKNGREVRVQVLNPAARRVLDHGYRHGEYMFRRDFDGKPFTGQHLSHAFSRARSKVPGFDQKRQLRALRHTTIYELALSGCNIPEIASITSHTLSTVHRTLEHYLPKTSELAQQAMRKRENRRLMNIHGIEGEVIVEGARRIFLGAIPQALIPAPPQERVRDAA